MAARVLKPYDERRGELLDAAQALFIRGGYEATPVAAIIDAVGVSKGTFYHYFDSKEDLLDGLVERITDGILEEIREAIAEGRALGAIERLNLYFTASSRWKAAHRDELMAVMRPMYSDDNLRVRHKMRRRALERGAGVLAEIIRQGVAEGVFDPTYADEAAEMILRMGFGLRSSTVRHLLATGQDPHAWDSMLRLLRCYQEGVERILGAPEGSIRIIDEQALRAFTRDSGRTGSGPTRRD